MDLSFYSNLSEEQKSYADKIAARARQMGIPPQLAVAVAYQESRLNPKVAQGAAGEIGIMQIKPTTAEEMGFSRKDIQDPDRNIDAGLTYLKKSFDMSEGNPKLAAAGYNAGVNHPFFTPQGNKLPDSTISYIKNLDSFGAFNMPAPPKQAEEPTEERTSDEVYEDKARALGGIGGGILGAGVTAKRAAMDVARPIGRAAMNLAQTGGRKLAGSIAEEISSRIPQPPSVNDAMQTRILQGTTDPTSGATGRARLSGFNIETAQQAARTKEAADRIGALQRAGLVSQGASNVLAQAPGLTASPSGVIVPRSAGPAAPPPTPSRGALEEVSNLFRNMMGPESKLGGFGRAAMRYGAPPLALYQTGSELGSMASQLDREERDYPKAFTSGLGALGAFGSMFPTTAPFAIPLAVAAPLMGSAIDVGRTRPLGQMGDVVAP